MFDLSGRAALVTGASGGIGGAVASTLAAAGAKVALSGTRKDVLEARVAEIGRGAVALPCDLSEPGAVERLVPQAEEALGGLDILVNNAGLTRDNLLMRMRDDEWADVLEVNLTAAFRLARAAAKNMMRQRRGRIVSIASVVGVTGNPGQANYAASKAGLIAMTKSLAAELARRGVTANCVAPGMIATAMTDALSEAQREAIVSRIPTGQLGAPQDVAGAVLYLASDEAAYVTGQTIHVNGGLAMI